MASSGRINNHHVVVQNHSGSRITTSTAFGNVHKSSRQESVIASDSVICLDEDYKGDLNNNQTVQNTQQYNPSFEHFEIEPEYEADTIGNQQPRQHRSKTKRKRQTQVINKKFKCAKCYFRSNWPKCVLTHFKITHQQETFNRTRCIQVLDDKKATRTVAAYDQHFAYRKFDCKPFKCCKCEHRSAQRCNALSHMRNVHKVDMHEAKRLLRVLPLDEAEKTVGDYNKNKFACQSFRNLLLEREKETKPATTSKNQSSFGIFKTENIEKRW
jgi:hypothetical protein